MGVHNDERPARTPDELRRQLERLVTESLPGLSSLERLEPYLRTAQGLAWREVAQGDLSAPGRWRDALAPVRRVARQVSDDPAAAPERIRDAMGVLAVVAGLDLGSGALIPLLGSHSLGRPAGVAAGMPLD